jgi:hypothetical protein
VGAGDRRCRGRGWLAELRQRDLALTLPETAELFTALGEHRLTAQSGREALASHRKLGGRAAAGRHRAQGPRRRRGRGGRVLRTPMAAGLLGDELLRHAPPSCRSSWRARRSPMC